MIVTFDKARATEFVNAAFLERPITLGEDPDDALLLAATCLWRAWMRTAPQALIHSKKHAERRDFDDEEHKKRLLDAISWLSDQLAQGCLPTAPKELTVQLSRDEFGTVTVEPL